MEKISAIILGAGSGSRMGNEQNKLFLEINGIPILARTLKNFVDYGLTGEIVVVLNSKDIDTYNKIIKEPYGFNNVKVVEGGKTRSESSLKGLMALDKDTDYVLIQDGARPFSNNEIIKDNIDTVRKFGSAVTGIPVTSTIKITDDKGNIEISPKRERIIEAQTPQAFSYPLIMEAYKQIGTKPTTDDSSVLEQLGYKPHISKGSRQNIKITTPDDLMIAEAIASSLSE